MTSLVASLTAHLVILGVCVFLLLRNIRPAFVMFFAVAALLRCLAFAPAAFMAGEASTSVPLLGIARIANAGSLALFAAGFVLLAAWLSRSASRSDS